MNNTHTKNCPCCKDGSKLDEKCCQNEQGCCFGKGKCKHIKCFIFVVILAMVIFGSFYAFTTYKNENRNFFDNKKDTRFDYRMNNNIMPARTDAKAMGMVEGDSSVLPPYNPVTIKYVYTGDIVLPQKLIGYKSTNRQFPLPKAKDMNIPVDIVDLSKFNDIQVQNITLLEDKDKGYSIYLDMATKTASIQQNYEKWKKYMPNCTTEECWSQSRIKKTDLPSDEKTLSIANDFLAKYNMDISKYGKPSIVKYWENQTGEIYFPESIQVIYPIIVNNQEVYEEYGQKAGMSVNVNVRASAVDGMYGLSKFDVEEKSFDVEKKEELAKYIEDGGLFSYKDPNAKDIVEVKLDSPVQVLTRYFVYKNNVSSEYFAPALRFKVIQEETKKDVYTPEYVTIPLARDIIKDLKDSNGGIPMPLGGIEARSAR